MPRPRVKHERYEDKEIVSIINEAEKLIATNRAGPPRGTMMPQYPRDIASIRFSIDSYLSPPAQPPQPTVSRPVTIPQKRRTTRKQKAEAVSSAHPPNPPEHAIGSDIVARELAELNEIQSEITERELVTSQLEAAQAQPDIGGLEISEQETSEAGMVESLSQNLENNNSVIVVESDDDYGNASSTNPPPVVDLCSPVNHSRRRRHVFNSIEIIELDENECKEPKRKTSRTRNNKSPDFRKESPPITKIINCAICLESPMEKTPTSTNCGHIFCKECIVKSIKFSKKCPICMRPCSLKSLILLYI